MSELLRRLLGYFRLAIEAEDDDGTDAVEAEITADDGADTGDDSLDDLLDAAEDDGGTPKTADKAESAAAKETRRRLQEKDQELDNERRARYAAEQRAAPQRQGPDPQTAAEDQEYAAAVAAGKDPEALKWLAWQIQSNRTIRATNQSSRNSEMRAQDMFDKNAFDRLEITNPKVYSRYAKRVEDALQQARAQGNNAPRNVILRLLIGDDIMNGKVKSKTKAKGKEASSTAGKVDRGRGGGVRTDVGKGGTSNRDKLRAKLENQLI